MTHLPQLGDVQSAEHVFFPQHILPLLPLYNAQWWGYESLTAIALVDYEIFGKHMNYLMIVLSFRLGVDNTAYVFHTNDALIDVYNMPSNCCFESHIYGTLAF